MQAALQLCSDQPSLTLERFLAAHREFHIAKAAGLQKSRAMNQYNLSMSSVIRWEQVKARAFA